MSNKIEQALRAAIECFEQNPSVYADDEIELCKAALSEIGKCEPVAIVTSITGSGGNRSHISKTTSFINGLINIGDGIYTSPQPHEWVGLSADGIKELSSHLWVAGAISRDELAKVIEAKLKQLNTKG